MLSLNMYCGLFSIFCKKRLETSISKLYLHVVKLLVCIALRSKKFPFDILKYKLQIEFAL